MKDIFISYARQDQPWVQMLVRKLEEENLTVWWDRTIPPGKTFEEVITEALDKAKCVIVIWSKTSIGSQWVKAEAEEGRGRGVLYPVSIDETKPPLVFRHIQAAQLADWDGKAAHPQFRLLINSIRDVVRGNLEVPEPTPNVEADRGGWEVSTNTSMDWAETTTQETTVRQTGAEQAPVVTDPAPPPAVPGPGGETVQKAGKSNRRHLYRLLLGLLVTLAIVIAILPQHKPDFDPLQLRVGLLMRDNWTDSEARLVYGELLAQFNKRLTERKDGFAVSKRIRLFRKPAEAIETLKRGEIEIAGELSPRGIYQAESASKAQPFVSPLYGGSHHYTSVFFVSANYVKEHNLDPEAKDDIWQQVVSDLSNPDTGYSVAVSDTSSTSGYWYPRYELVRSLRGSKSFDEISWERNSYKEIYTAVEHGYNGVVVGAIAKFRFCDTRYVSTSTKEECKQQFIRLDDTSQIPQGGFVLSKALITDLKSKELVETMQRAWKASVTATYKEATGSSGITTKLVKRHIPKAWGGVSNKDYAKAREVFDLKDATGARISATNDKLIFTGIAIIILVTLLFVWLRRPPKQQVTK
ncbi:MAG: TIR domain-containing protein [Gammaproteobacteria bacterium]|nr:TIR domain-containing protein [Gammaproteobacteria bacterium]